MEPDTDENRTGGYYDENRDNDWDDRGAYDEADYGRPKSGVNKVLIIVTVIVVLVAGAFAVKAFVFPDVKMDFFALFSGNNSESEDTDERTNESTNENTDENTSEESADNGTFSVVGNERDEAPTEGAIEDLDAAVSDAGIVESTGPSVDYLLPFSASRELTEDDISSMDELELTLARNEIYARHGKLFDTPEIQSYFDGLQWYRNISEKESDIKVSDLELKNAEFIIAYAEDKFGRSTYYK
jgi:hypothetical protein